MGWVGQVHSGMWNLSSLYKWTTHPLTVMLDLPDTCHHLPNAN